MSRPWRESEYARLMVAMRRDIATVQADLMAPLLPILQRLVRDTERPLYAAAGRWNRHQMIGDLGRR